MRTLPILATLVVLVAACSHTAPSTVRFPALYIDMDGTMLSTDHQPRPATLAALKRYQACGGKVGIATGRTYEQVVQYLPAIQPDLPIVLFNGAVTMQADGTTLASVGLSPEAQAAALRTAPGLPGVVSTVVHEAVNTYPDNDSPEFLAFLKRGHVTPTAVIKDLATGYDGHALKIMIVVQENQGGAVAESLQKALGDTARAMVTSPRTVEIVAPGVHKANAISKVLASKGMDTRDVLTIGDSGNDVEMLSQLGPGLAMGNCRPAACNAALARIGANDTDAIADVIETLAIHPSCQLDQ